MMRSPVDTKRRPLCHTRPKTARGVPATFVAVPLATVKTPEGALPRSAGPTPAKTTSPVKANAVGVARPVAMRSTVAPVAAVGSGGACPANAGALSASEPASAAAAASRRRDGDIDLPSGMGRVRSDPRHAATARRPPRGGRPVAFRPTRTDGNPAILPEPDRRRRWVPTPLRAGVAPGRFGP